MIFSFLVSAVLCAPQDTRRPYSGFKGVNVAGPEFGEVFPGVQGQDYFFDTSPNLASMKSYAAANVDAYRLPFAWERMQPVLGGDLDPKYLGEYQAALKLFPAQSTIIVDCHNYAQYRKKFIGVAGSSVTDEHFADLWVKLGNALKTCNTCIFGLMNEPPFSPGGMSDDQWGESWARTSVYATNAMRKAGIQQKIAITGVGYSKPDTYNPSVIPTDNALKALTNMLIEFHVYYDRLWDSGSNTWEECRSFPNMLSTIQALTVSLRQKKQQAFMGEIATNRRSGCIEAAKALADHVKNNADVWVGIVAWGGGEHYNPPENDAISLRPASDGSTSPMLATVLPSLNA